jgi:hypothetical protein
MLYDTVCSLIFLNGIKQTIYSVGDSTNTLPSKNMKWRNFIRHSDFALAVISSFSILRMASQAMENIHLKFLIVNGFEMARAIIVSQNSRLLLDKS